MKPFAEKFYHSVAWRNKCRDAYSASQHGICERCMEAGKIVHHKTYITPDNLHDPDITLNFDNLELVCQDCHNKEHHSTHEPLREGVMFDVDGNLIKKHN